MTKPPFNNNTSIAIVTKQKVISLTKQIPGGYLLKPRYNPESMSVVENIIATLNKQALVTGLKDSVKKKYADRRREVTQKKATEEQTAFDGLQKTLGIAAVTSKNTPNEKEAEIAGMVTTEKPKIDKELKKLLEDIIPAKNKTLVPFHVTPKSQQKKRYKPNIINKENALLSIFNFPETPAYVQQIKDMYNLFDMVAEKGEHDTFAYIHDLVIKHKDKLRSHATILDEFLLFQNNIPNALNILTKRHNIRIQKHLLFLLVTNNLKNQIKKHTYMNYNTIVSFNVEELKSLQEILRNDGNNPPKDFAEGLSIYVEQCILYLYRLELL